MSSGIVTASTSFAYFHFLFFSAKTAQNYSAAFYYAIPFNGYLVSALSLLLSFNLERRKTICDKLRHSTAQVKKG